MSRPCRLNALGKDKKIIGCRSTGEDMQVNEEEHQQKK